MVIIYNEYSSKNLITNNSKTLEHKLLLQITHIFNDNQFYHQTTKIYQLNETHINKQNIYRNSKSGDNIHADENCGIYALCNATNDSQENKIISIANLLNILKYTKILIRDLNNHLSHLE